MIRSKWLDWQPGGEIIEKISDTKPTEPTKRTAEAGFVGLEGTAEHGLPIKNETCEPESDGTELRGYLRAVDPL